MLGVFVWCKQAKEMLVGKVTDRPAKGLMTFMPRRGKITLQARHMQVTIQAGCSYASNPTGILTEHCSPRGFPADLQRQHVMCVGRYK